MRQQVVPATQNMTAAITAFGDIAKNDNDYNVQIKENITTTKEIR